MSKAAERGGGNGHLFVFPRLVAAFRLRHSIAGASFLLYSPAVMTCLEYSNLAGAAGMLKGSGVVGMMRRMLMLGHRSAKREKHEWTAKTLPG
ncbi:MAG: hypothetical protein A2X56_11745 [Nitrospirae bacterium GWC2_57_13]|nr:MAG: hypothetical protein A2X56_11745 [Nitrospirae bacterium GWC2_57_13]OGW41739.1 MAG: hypothetical protein A2X57_08785 [Nitrospirae bacterium GWD2_57_8]HAS54368.1 hypothetical protein [Nitrospiraceae bacterium]